MKPDTRHLDMAISILSGAGKPKRAPRKAQVELVVVVDPTGYTITSNGRELVRAAGDKQEAQAVANQTAERIRKLGKTVCITIY